MGSSIRLGHPVHSGVLRLAGGGSSSLHSVSRIRAIRVTSWLICDLDSPRLYTPAQSLFMRRQYLLPDNDPSIPTT